ncbi:MAG: hypothetical protein NTX44_01605 [Ignavibacteriales bacterium]|nr:hypothetical protein [Ignavibacteriales bacterium]
MKAWERRLKDLSMILNTCHRYYFEPERFRLSLNQFLQTSRTVTFIIQKKKDEIPDFDKWYEQATLFWKHDKILLWAKDSRNVIEKMGDLDLFSFIKISLVRSYIEAQDTVVQIQEDKYLFVAITEIYNYLKTELTFISDDEWAIKVERRWTANTLPNEELLWVLNMIYYHQYQICKEACNQVGSTLSTEIPEPIEMDTGLKDSRHIRYIDSEGQEFKQLKAFRIDRDPGFKANKKLLDKQRERFKKIDNFEVGMEILSNNAAELFIHDGYHIPMLFSFDSKMNLIDLISAAFYNSAVKFIFWREIADRLASQNPYCMYFVSEAWIRKMPDDISRYHAISSLPIRGEMLQVVGITNKGEFLHKCFEITRHRFDHPTLGECKSIYNDDGKIPQFLQPVAEAISIKRRENV